ncbi:hypothetical protein IHQ71_23300 [Rhizobium sp. TH2]|uniref:hypothetical protein n=1 Tax=Rhizobium sp. TH2 TaxID=2775403 RepID=UPI0021580EA6|nr:hypothetical protein [Rhizobium sp. TH2]UVC08057.1 hypothetical protein IHQ71_23300 [Rhizobium sp. TH2]
MSIFGESRLGRIGYIVIILLMLGFDFAKQPIERYIVRLQDATAEELLKPRKVTSDGSADVSMIKDRPMPFMMQAHEDIVRDIVKSGRKYSKKELEAVISARLKETPLSFMPNHNAPKEVVDLANRHSALSALYPMAVIAMTAITIITLLWMVSARLRDIGWPQFWLFAIIAPVFVPRLMALPLPAEIAQVLGWLFYSGIAVLAFIPAGGFASGPPPPTAATVQPVTVRRQSGQFGRLGT